MGIPVNVDGTNGISVHAERQLPLIALRERWYTPNLVLPSHGHDQGFTCLLLQGAYVERVGRRTTPVRPYQSFYHPPGLAHSLAVCARGMRALMIEFDRSLFVATDAADHELSEVRHTSRPDLVRKMLGLFESIDSFLPLEIESRAVDLVSVIVAAAKRPHISSRTIRAARDFVLDNYRSNVTLAEVAKAIGVHPVYLSHAFVNTLKQTLGDYVNDLRVRSAAESLSSSDLPLAEIAVGNGFYDQSHFTRVFRVKVGMTPGAFRRRYGASPGRWRSQSET